jgi:hypothetical protein
LGGDELRSGEESAVVGGVSGRLRSIRRVGRMRAALGTFSVPQWSGGALEGDPRWQPGRGCPVTGRRAQEGEEAKEREGKGRRGASWLQVTSPGGSSVVQVQAGGGNINGQRAPRSYSLSQRRRQKRFVNKSSALQIF